MNEQNKDNIESSLIPKSSGYAVSERWNDTTVEIVNEVAVSADGKYMAVVTNWDATPGSDIFFYNTSDHDGIPMWSYDAAISFDSLAISANGSYIIAGSSASNIAYLFNSSVPYPGNDKDYIYYVDWGEPINSVDVSADGKLIVLGGSYGGGDGGILSYNNSHPPGGWGTNKEADYLWKYETTMPFLSVAISADGKYVVGAQDLTWAADEIFFLNTTDYTLGSDQVPMWSYNTSATVNTVAISATGEYVVAGTSQQDPGDELFVFNKSTNNGIPEWSYDYGTGTLIHSVAISADGEYIATGCEGPTPTAGIVGLFSNSKSQNLWNSSTGGKVNTVDITEDGKYIVAGTNYQLGNGRFNETVLLYKQSANPTGNALPEWAFNTSNDVNSVSISALGNYIGAGGVFTLGSGRAYLFYARTIQSIISSNGDDDDDDDEEAAIPFGNHYLLFAAIAIASLVIITKRKAVFSKK
ncbi:MAG: hypothetical protein EU532_00935 [Promethearchaeota archaeon]|nr:MAG: hypothetical protein EU532_00935 [Candidatus Lokiarchaeota archaeon]